MATKALYLPLGYVATRQTRNCEYKGIHPSQINKPRDCATSLIAPSSGLCDVIAREFPFLFLVYPVTYLKNPAMSLIAFTLDAKI